MFSASSSSHQERNADCFSAWTQPNLNRSCMERFLFVYQWFNFGRRWQTLSSSWWCQVSGTCLSIWQTLSWQHDGDLQGLFVTEVVSEESTSDADIEDPCSVFIVCASPYISSVPEVKRGSGTWSQSERLRTDSNFPSLHRLQLSRRQSIFTPRCPNLAILSLSSLHPSHTVFDARVRQAAAHTSLSSLLLRINKTSLLLNHSRSSHTHTTEQLLISLKYFFLLMFSHWTSGLTWTTLNCTE